MASTPRKKPSPSTGKRSSSSAGKLTPAKLYLVLYNLSCASAWGYVLFRLFLHLKDGAADGGLKGAVGGLTLAEKLTGRSRTSYADFGAVVKWVQTAALLEIVHAALGIVRSGLGTTIAQLSSRVLIVWYICPFYPQVAASPAYSSMVFAWSFTEVVRYSHYVASLLAIKLPVLEWLRYSTFYPLYPLGALSEAWLIFRTAPYARHTYGLPGFWATLVLVTIWPPALLSMMSHMHRQRFKHLINPSGHGSAKKVSSATRAKIESAQSTSPAGVAASSGTDTPTRITRSRAAKASPST